MFLASMETERFSWQAFDLSEEGAKRVLFEAFVKHIRSSLTSGPAADTSGEDWFQDCFHGDVSVQTLDDWYGIVVTEFEVGQAFRDGWRLA